MIFLRSLVFNILFFGVTIFLLIACLPAPFVARDGVHVIARLWSRTAVALLRVVCNLDYRVVGRENIPTVPVIIASKHQSAWDTIVMPLLLRQPAFILKKELMSIPLFGMYLKAAGQIPIDRAAGARTLREMIRAAKSVIADNRPVLIYPEGTRTPPGRTADYFSGVGVLYRALGVPVVPVALNSGIYWERRGFRKRPGTIVLEFLEPIPPGLDAREFLAELETRIEPATRRLEAAAGLTSSSARRSSL